MLVGFWFVMGSSSCIRRKHVFITSRNRDDLTTLSIAAHRIYCIIQAELSGNYTTTDKRTDGYSNATVSKYKTMHVLQERPWNTFQQLLRQVSFVWKTVQTLLRHLSKNSSCSLSLSSGGKNVPLSRLSLMCWSRTNRCGSVSAVQHKFGIKFSGSLNGIIVLPSKHWSITSSRDQ